MFRQVCQLYSNRLARRHHRGSAGSQNRRLCAFEPLEQRWLFNADRVLDLPVPCADPGDGELASVAELTSAPQVTDSRQPGRDYDTSLWLSYVDAALECQRGAPRPTPTPPLAVDDLQRPADRAALPTEEITLAYTKAEWNCHLTSEVARLDAKFDARVAGDTPGESGPVTESLPMFAVASVPDDPRGDIFSMTGADHRTGSRRDMPGEVQVPVDSRSLQPGYTIILPQNPYSLPVSAADQALVEMAGFARSERLLDAGGREDFCPNWEPFYDWDDWLEWLY